MSIVRLEAQDYKDLKIKKTELLKFSRLPGKYMRSSPVYLNLITNTLAIYLFFYSQSKPYDAKT